MGQGVDAKLIQTFLCKLELERISQMPISTQNANSDNALLLENQILKERLKKLKESIAVLNNMVEHIKLSPKGQNITIFSKNQNHFSNDEQMEVNGLAKEIDQLQNQNFTLKEQNDRLIEMNGKLLSESESLRIELRKLRELLSSTGINFTRAKGFPDSEQRTTASYKQNLFTPDNHRTPINSPGNFSMKVHTLEEENQILRKQNKDLEDRILEARRAAGSQFEGDYERQLRELGHILNSKESEISDLTRMLKDHQDLSNALRTQLDSLKVNQTRTEYTKEYIIIRDENHTLKERLERKQSEVENLSRMLSELEVRLNSKQQSNRKDEVDQLQILIHDLSKKLNDKELEIVNLRSIREQNVTITNRVQFLEEEIRRYKLSPQPNRNQNAELLEVELAKFKDILQKKEDEIKNQSRHIMNKEREISMYENEILQLKGRIEGLKYSSNSKERMLEEYRLQEDQLRYLKEDNDRLIDEVFGLKRSLEDAPRIEKIKELEIQILEKVKLSQIQADKISSLGVEITDLSRMLKLSENRLISANNEINLLIQAKAERDKLQQDQISKMNDNNSNAEGRLKKVFESEFENLNSQIRHLKEQLEQSEHHHNVTIMEYEKRIEDLNTKLNEKNNVRSSENEIELIEIEKLKVTISERDSEIRSYQTKLKDFDILNTELRTTKSILEAKEKENNRLNDDLTRYQNKLQDSASKEKSIFSLKIEIEDLLRDLKRKDQDISALEKKLIYEQENSASTIKNLKQKISESENVMIDLKNIHQVEINKMRTQIDSSVNVSEVERLKNEVSVHERNLQNHKDEIASWTERYSKLNQAYKDEIDKSRNIAESASKEIPRYKKLLNEKEMEIDEIKRSLRAIESTVRDRELQNENLASQVDKEKRDKEHLASQFERSQIEAEEYINKLKNEKEIFNEETRRTHSTLNEKIQELERNKLHQDNLLDELKTELRKLTLENTHLTETISHQHSKQNILSVTNSKTIESLEQEKFEHLNTIEDFKRKLKLSQEEVERLKEEILLENLERNEGVTKLSDELIELKNQLIKERNTIDELERKIKERGYEIEDKERRLSQLQNELDSLTSEKKALYSTTEELRKLTRDYKNQIDEEKRQVKILREELDSKERKMISIGIELDEKDKRLGASNSRVQEIEQSIRDLKNDLETKDRSIRNLSVDLEGKTKRHSTLLEEIQQKDKKIQEILNDGISKDTIIKELSDDLDDMKRCFENVQGEKDILSIEIENQKNALEAKEGKIINLNIISEELKKEKEELEETIAEMKKKLNDTSDQTSNLRRNLDSRIIELTAELRSARSSQDQSEKRLFEIKEELEDAVKEKKKLLNDKMESESSMKRLNFEIESIQSKFERSQSTCNTQKEDINSLKKEIENLSNELSNKSSLILDLEQKIDSQSKIISQEKESYDRRIHSIEQELNEKDKLLKEQESKNNDLEKRLRDLFLISEQQEVFKSRNTELLSRVDLLMEEQKEQENSQQILKRRVLELEPKLSKTLKEYSDCMEELNAAKLHISNLNSEMRGVQTELNKLEDKHRNLQQNLENSINENKTKETVNTELKNELDSLKMIYSTTLTLEMKNKSLTQELQEIPDLRSKIESLESINTTLELKITKLSEKIESLEENNNTLVLKIPELNKQIELLEKNKVQLEEEITNLRNMLELVESQKETFELEIQELNKHKTTDNEMISKVTFLSKTIQEVNLQNEQLREKNSIIQSDLNEEIRSSSEKQKRIRSLEEEIQRKDLEISTLVEEINKIKTQSKNKIPRLDIPVENIDNALGNSELDLEELKDEPSLDNTGRTINANRKGLISVFKALNTLKITQDQRKSQNDELKEKLMKVISAIITKTSYLVAQDSVKEDLSVNKNLQEALVVSELEQVQNKSMCKSIEIIEDFMKQLDSEAFEELNYSPGELMTDSLIQSGNVDRSHAIKEAIVDILKLDPRNTIVRKSLDGAKYIIRIKPSKDTSNVLPIKISIPSAVVDRDSGIEIILPIGPDENKKEYFTRVVVKDGKRFSELIQICKKQDIERSLSKSKYSDPSNTNIIPIDNLRSILPPGSLHNLEKDIVGIIMNKKESALFGNSFAYLDELIKRLLIDETGEGQRHFKVNAIDYSNGIIISEKNESVLNSALKTLNKKAQEEFINMVISNLSKERMIDISEKVIIQDEQDEEIVLQILDIPSKNKGDIQNKIDNAITIKIRNISIDSESGDNDAILEICSNGLKTIIEVNERRKSDAHLGLITQDMQLKTINVEQNEFDEQRDNSLRETFIPPNTYKQILQGLRYLTTKKPNESSSFLKARLSSGSVLLDTVDLMTDLESEYIDTDRSRRSSIKESVVINRETGEIGIRHIDSLNGELVTSMIEKNKFGNSIIKEVKREQSGIPVKSNIPIDISSGHKGIVQLLKDKSTSFQRVIYQLLRGLSVDIPISNIELSLFTTILLDFEYISKKKYSIIRDSTITERDVRLLEHIVLGRDNKRKYNYFVLATLEIFKYTSTRNNPEILYWEANRTYVNPQNQKMTISLRIPKSTTSSELKELKEINLGIISVASCEIISSNVGGATHCLYSGELGTQQSLAYDELVHNDEDERFLIRLFSSQTRPQHIKYMMRLSTPLELSERKRIYFEDDSKLILKQKDDLDRILIQEKLIDENQNKIISEITIAPENSDFDIEWSSCYSSNNEENDQQSELLTDRVIDDTTKEELGRLIKKSILETDKEDDQEDKIRGQFIIREKLLPGSKFVEQFILKQKLSHRQYTIPEILDIYQMQVEDRTIEISDTRSLTGRGISRRKEFSVVDSIGGYGNILSLFKDYQSTEETFIVETYFDEYKRVLEKIYIDKEIPDHVQAEKEGSNDYSPYIKHFGDRVKVIERISIQLKPEFTNKMPMKIELSMVRIQKQSFYSNMIFETEIEISSLDEGILLPNSGLKYKMSTIGERIAQVIDKSSSVVDSFENKSCISQFFYFVYQSHSPTMDYVIRIANTHESSNIYEFDKIEISKSTDNTPIDELTCIHSQIREYFIFEDCEIEGCRIDRKCYDGDNIVLEEITLNLIKLGKKYDSQYSSEQYGTGLEKLNRAVIQSKIQIDDAISPLLEEQKEERNYFLNVDYLSKSFIEPELEDTLKIMFEQHPIAKDTHNKSILIERIAGSHVILERLEYNKKQMIPQNNIHSEFSPKLVERIIIERKDLIHPQFKKSFLSQKLVSEIPMYQIQELEERGISYKSIKREIYSYTSKMKCLIEYSVSDHGSEFSLISKKEEPLTDESNNFSIESNLGDVVAMFAYPKRFKNENTLLREREQGGYKIYELIDIEGHNCDDSDDNSSEDFYVYIRERVAFELQMNLPDLKRSPRSSKIRMLRLESKNEGLRERLENQKKIIEIIKGRGTNSLSRPNKEIKSRISILPNMERENEFIHRDEIDDPTVLSLRYLADESYKLNSNSMLCITISNGRQQTNVLSFNSSEMKEQARQGPLKLTNSTINSRLEIRATTTNIPSKFMGILEEVTPNSLIALITEEMLISDQKKLVTNVEVSIPRSIEGVLKDTYFSKSNSSKEVYIKGNENYFGISLNIMHKFFGNISEFMDGSAILRVIIDDKIITFDRLTLSEVDHKIYANVKERIVIIRNPEEPNPKILRINPDMILTDVSKVIKHKITNGEIVSEELSLERNQLIIKKLNTVEGMVHSIDNGESSRIVKKIGENMHSMLKNLKAYNTAESEVCSSHFLTSIKLIMTNSSFEPGQIILESISPSGTSLVKVSHSEETDEYTPICAVEIESDRSPTRYKLINDEGNGLIRETIFTSSSGDNLERIDEHSKRSQMKSPKLLLPLREIMEHLIKHKQEIFSSDFIISHEQFSKNKAMLRVFQIHKNFGVHHKLMKENMVINLIDKSLDQSQSPKHRFNICHQMFVDANEIQEELELIAPAEVSLEAKPPSYFKKNVKSKKIIENQAKDIYRFGKKESNKLPQPFNTQDAIDIFLKESRDSNYSVQEKVEGTKKIIEKVETVNGSEVVTERFIINNKDIKRYMESIINEDKAEGADELIKTMLMGNPFEKNRKPNKYIFKEVEGIGSELIKIADQNASPKFLKGIEQIVLNIQEGEGMLSKIEDASKRGIYKDSRNHGGTPGIDLGGINNDNQRYNFNAEIRFLEEENNGLKEELTRLRAQENDQSRSDSKILKKLDLNFKSINEDIEYRSEREDKLLSEIERLKKQSLEAAESNAEKIEMLQSEIQFLKKNSTNLDDKDRRIGLLQLEIENLKLNKSDQEKHILLLQSEIDSVEKKKSEDERQHSQKIEQLQSKIESLKNKETEAARNYSLQIEQLQSDTMLENKNNAENIKNYLIQIEQLNSQISRIQSELRSSEENVSAKLETIELLSSEIKELKESVHDKNDQIRRFEAEFLKNTSSREEHLKALQQKVSDLQLRLNQEEDEKNVMKSNLDQLNRQCITLEGEITFLNESCKRNESLLDSTRGNLKRAEDSLNEHITKLSVANSRNKTLECELEESETQIELLSKKLESANLQLTKTAVDSNSSKGDVSRIELEGLRQQLEDRNSKIASLQQDMLRQRESLFSDIEDLRKEIIALQKKLKQAENSSNMSRTNSDFKLSYAGEGAVKKIDEYSNVEKILTFTDGMSRAVSDQEIQLVNDLREKNRILQDDNHSLKMKIVSLEKSNNLLHQASIDIVDRSSPKKTEEEHYDGKIFEKYMDLRSQNNALMKENLDLRSELTKTKDRMINWAHGNMSASYMSPNMITRSNTMNNDIKVMTTQVLEDIHTMEKSILNEGSPLSLRRVNTHITHVYHSRSSRKYADITPDQPQPRSNMKSGSQEFERSNLRVVVEELKAKLKKKESQLRDLEEEFNRMKKQYKTSLSKSEAEASDCRSKVNTAEHQLEIINKENMRLMQEIKKARFEIESVVAKSTISGTTSQGQSAIDLLRSKASLLLRQLEVLVNEISKTEQTSKGQLDLVKHWLSTTDVEWKDTVIANMVSKLKELDFNSFKKRVEKISKHRTMDQDLYNTISNGYQKLISAIELDLKSCKKDLVYKTKILDRLTLEIRQSDPSIQIPARLRSSEIPI